MMSPILQQRFDQLLELAKEPKFSAVARENLASAKELVDTLLAVGLLLPEEYRAYRAQVATTAEVIGAVELKRATDAIWNRG